MKDHEVDIAQISAQLQQDADDLLVASELISLLEKYGRTRITGSYQYRLMTVPDIDIYVTNQCAGRDQAKRILYDLIDQAFWRGFSIEDFIEFPHEQLPIGIYIGLKQVFRGRLWKADIWNLTEVPKATVALDTAMSEITEAHRMAILQIKHWRDSGAHKIAAKDIYDAVISEKAHDVESFRRLIGISGSLSGGMS